MLYTIEVTKTLIFDVGGVLMEDADAFDSMYKTVSKKAGLTPEEMAELWARHYPQMAIGQRKLKDFFREVARVAKKKTAGVTLFNLYKKASKVDKKIFTVVKDLKKKGYKLLILSNDTPEGAALRVNQFKKLFDKLYVSSVVGIKKPDPKIFQLIIKAEKIDPKETFFIDDRERNLVTAKTLGFKTILFKSLADLPKDFS